MIKKTIKAGLNFIGIDIKSFRPESVNLGWVNNLGINTVIDIGANVGQFALEIRKELPSTKLYSFEPIKRCYEKLTRNMGEDENFKAFNFALSDTNGKEKINISPYTPSSSFLKMSRLHETIFPHTRGRSGEETVITKRLDDIFKTMDCPKNILIKIDVQGYENKVIGGAINAIREAKALLVETSFYPLYENQPLFDEIYQLLKDIGFRYAGCSNRKKNPLDGKILFEDSIFISKKS